MLSIYIQHTRWCMRQNMGYYTMPIESNFIIVLYSNGLKLIMKSQVLLRRLLAFAANMF
jgi:hypothetical protein